jgi:hypothetical protein
MEKNKRKKIQEEAPTGGFQETLISMQLADQQVTCGASGACEKPR